MGNGRNKEEEGGGDWRGVTSGVDKDKYHNVLSRIVWTGYMYFLLVYCQFFSGNVQLKNVGGVTRVSILSFYIYSTSGDKVPKYQHAVLLK